MGRITTYDEAIVAIWDRSSYDRGFISNPFAGDDAARLGLRRTRAMLDRVGNPERSYPIVHVAGSKGKGSTCVFIDAMLRASGHRSGRHLSPHLHAWPERFVVDDVAISHEDFATLTADLVTVAETIERDAPELGQVTAFELTTAMAFLWFQRAGCDIAVVEVGLGGTLDATNVVDPAVSVITQLDFEHIAILGSTMTEIAGNKAGIIKPGRPVVTAAQPEDGLAVIRARAEACDAPLLVADQDWATTGSDRSFTATGPWGTLPDLRIELAGRHQVDNAGLAIAAIYTLTRTDAPLHDITHEAIHAGLREARHPGRFEVVTLASGQTVIIDGAHSPASTAALAGTVRERFPDTPVAIVAGMLADKEPGAVLAPLADLATHWIAVAPDTPRALTVDELRTALDMLSASSIASTTVADGLGLARRLAVPVILVTGSLTTAAEARVALDLA